jgi:hypothetical protein
MTSPSQDQSTVVKMPSGKEIKVPDDLIREGHAAVDGNFRPLILDKSVKNYNHDEKTKAGFQYAIKEIGKVDADFTGRLADYNDARLKSVLNALYGGTNLPPVSVRKTGAFPPYTLEDGYHRYIASLIAGFSEIPCFIRDDPEPKAPIQPKSIATLKRPPQDETDEEARARRKARFG